MNKQSAPDPRDLSLVQQRFEEHQAVIAAASSSLQYDLARAGNLLYQTYCQGGKAIFFGNGGSAADAQHLAAELTGR